MCSSCLKRGIGFNSWSAQGGNDFASLSTEFLSTAPPEGRCGGDVLLTVLEASSSVRGGVGLQFRALVAVVFSAGKAGGLPGRVGGVLRLLVGEFTEALLKGFGLAGFVFNAGSLLFEPSSGSALLRFGLGGGPGRTGRVGGVLILRSSNSSSLSSTRSASPTSTFMTSSSLTSSSMTSSSSSESRECILIGCNTGSE